MSKDNMPGFAIVDDHGRVVAVTRTREDAERRAERLIEYDPNQPMHVAELRYIGKLSIKVTRKHVWERQNQK